MHVLFFEYENNLLVNKEKVNICAIFFFFEIFLSKDLLGNVFFEKARLQG